MDQLDVLLFLLALVGYAVATFLYEIFLATRQQKVAHWGTGCLLLAWGIHSGALAARWVAFGQPPLSNLFEALSFYGWLLVLNYLVVEFFFDQEVLGAFVTPMVFLAMGIAALLPKQIRPLAGDLQTYWLSIHVPVSVLSYAAFTLATVTAVVYLLQERVLKSKRPGGLFYYLPPLHTMDKLSYLFIAVGFPLITFSIITGAIWADRVWNSYWNWEPTEVLALASWLIYAGYFHSRTFAGWQGRKSAWLVIVGFIAVWVTFLGANLVFTGLHRYNF